MRDFKCLSTIKSHNFHFDFATIISSAMKPSLEQLRLLGFWGTLINKPSLDGDESFKNFTV